jgi:hypothetical protein
LASRANHEWRHSKIAVEGGEVGVGQTVGFQQVTEVEDSGFVGDCIDTNFQNTELRKQTFNHIPPRARQH